jgi:uncharacterized membrane protein YjfL (UPF0719 family)
MGAAALIAETLNGDALRIGAYLVAAAGCIVVALRASVSRHDRRAAVVFWGCVAAVMLVLALGRFTELGPWLTERGRHIAEWQGWYDDRRDIQETAVFALIALGGAAVAAGLIWSARASSREHPLAVTAVVYLVTFVGVRAISLHQIDRVLYTERAVGIRPNGVLELAGSVLLAAAVLVALAPPSTNGGSA